MPDPEMPAGLRAELARELAAARLALVAAADATATNDAQARVRDAELAIGELAIGELAIGEHQPQAATSPELRERLSAAMRALLRHRGPERTICPSDAARVAGGSSWRPLMGAAREVAYGLAEAGVLEVRQRGVRVEPGQTRGPIRLAQGARFGSAVSPGPRSS